MQTNDTVYYWKNNMLEEATVFMFGGNNQVILDEGREWVLKYYHEIIPIKEMTEEDWKHVNL